MRKILFAVSLTAGFTVLCWQDAGAVPVNAAAFSTGTAAVEQVQYTEHRTRHGVVKCYRDLVIGPYRCHHYY
ncbi:MAG TPA: hypothetical protein VGG11_01080 [Xanthobacteraceae bacterium]